MKKFFLAFIGFIIHRFGKKADVSFVDFSLVDWVVPSSVPVIVSPFGMKKDGMVLQAAYVPLADYIVVDKAVYNRARAGHLKDQAVIVHEFRHAWQARNGHLSIETPIGKTYFAYMMSPHELDAHAVEDAWLQAAEAKYL